VHYLTAGQCLADIHAPCPPFVQVHQIWTAVPATGVATCGRDRGSSGADELLGLQREQVTMEAGQDTGIEQFFPPACRSDSCLHGTTPKKHDLKKSPPSRDVAQRYLKRELPMSEAISFS
jgi:hypothetical protein